MYHVSYGTNSDLIFTLEYRFYGKFSLAGGSLNRRRMN